MLPCSFTGIILAEASIWLSAARSLAVSKVVENGVRFLPTPIHQARSAIRSLSNTQSSLALQPPFISFSKTVLTTKCHSINRR
ncbi:uncharacterized protein HD556DRAFT_555171 [Suillus plorans]|uniref:Secreted protein n=1 Tax=Suillus plorans TaxID=116603 RepID=A0A9P7DH22_9AGAM|nr:uncharacterized protein HD556DRAFT_555171 [Suillus plorans]KAG1792418.1 hypothetical protein HD556DRAFT_555171 [Suillus plorans]